MKFDSRKFDSVNKHRMYPCTSRAHNKRRREEERVTPGVAVVTAESPACTINYMPVHMASLSKCEILIGNSFSIARRLNGHAKQTLKCFNGCQYSIFSTSGRFCLFHKTM